MPVRVKYVSYLIPLSHWWAEFFAATKIGPLMLVVVLYYILEKVRILNERNKQPE